MIILYDRAKVRHVYMILFVIFSNVALSKLPAHTLGLLSLYSRFNVSVHWRTKTCQWNLTIILSVCWSEDWPWINRSWWQTDNSGSNPTFASPKASGNLPTIEPFNGGEVWSDVNTCMASVDKPLCPLWHSFLAKEVETLVSVRLLSAGFNPFASICFGIWLPLIICGRIEYPSGTMVNWLWLLVLFLSPFSQTEAPEDVTVICLNREVKLGRGLARSFCLKISEEVWVKGTLVTGTVLVCVLTGAAVLEPFALELRSFPPSQGEDWLEGIAPQNKDVLIYKGLRFKGQFLHIKSQQNP